MKRFSPWLAALILTLSTILALMGCGTTAVPASASAPDPVDDVIEVTPAAIPVTVEGVVKEASLSKIVVTLADGTDLALNTLGISGLDVQLGDTVKVEYTGAADSAVATKVNVTKTVEPDLITAKVTGVVTKIESGFIFLALEDGTEAALETESVEEYGVEVGDTLTVEYVDSDSEDGVDVVSVQVTKAEKPEKTSASDTTAPVAGTQAASGSDGSDSSGSTGSTSTSDNPRGSSTVIIERDAREGFAWFRTVVDLGGTVTLDNLNRFASGEDLYPYGTSLYKAYYNFFMNEWDGVTDWRTVSLSDSNSDYDDDYYYDDDEDDHTSFSGSFFIKDNGPAEGAGDVYEAIRLINAERVKAGLSELGIDSELMEMAAVRTKETVELTGHTRPDGRYFDSVLTDFGWEVSQYYTAENLAYGQTTASEAVDWWMNSSVHKANILKSTVSRIGVAYYYDSDSEWGHYWTMIATS